MRLPSRPWRAPALLALGLLLSIFLSFAAGSSAAAGGATPPAAAPGLAAKTSLLVKAQGSYHGDLRRLPPAVFRAKPERIEHELPEEQVQPTGETAPLGSA